MSVRSANPTDRDAILAICRAAFPAEERDPVASLAVDLLALESSPRTLSLVAEDEDDVVGHVAFSPVGLTSDARFTGYLLAPLAVRPDCQARGLGTALVREGMRRVGGPGVDVLFVYGDPGYYGRFGFSAAAADGFEAPFPLTYDFGWQACHLQSRDAAPARGRITCVAPLNQASLW